MRETVKGEVYDASINAWERLAVAQCLQSHLVKLAAALNQSDGDWSGMPMPRHETATSMTALITPAYAAPSRFYYSDGWKNALASGVLNHMPSKDIDFYSQVFATMESLDQTQEVESSAATKLAPLSFPQHLSGRDRADMIANIAEVDRALSLINVDSKDLIEGVRDMHLGFDRKKLASDRGEVLHQQRIYRGSCVQDIPLDLG